MGVEHFLFCKDTLISHELATNHFISSLTNGGLHLYQTYNSGKYSLFHTDTANICTTPFSIPSPNPVTTISTSLVAPPRV